MPPGMAPDGTPRVCCPTINCSRRVGAPGAKFCDLCAAPLVPVSFELWSQKEVEPALANNFIGVLQGSPDLLASAFDLGLPEDEARVFLGQAFAEKAGASQEILTRWLNESVMPLRKAESLAAAAAVQDTFAKAERLNIARPYARKIVEHFVPKLGSTLEFPRDDSQIGTDAKSKADTSLAQQKKPDFKTIIPVVASTQDDARVAYRNLVTGDAPVQDFIYLSAEGSTAMGMLEEKHIYLVGDNAQGAFVLFPVDGKRGWVFPNPSLRFRPSALSPLFPTLTEDGFERNKENIQPCPAAKVAEGRWRIMSNENGFEAGGATTAEVANRYVKRKSVEEPLTGDEQTIVRPRTPQPNPVTNAQEITPVEIPVTRLSRVGLTLLVALVVLLGVVFIALWLDRSQRASSSRSGNVQNATLNNSNAQSGAANNSAIEALPTASPAEVASADESLDSNSNMGDADTEDQENALLTISVTLDGVSLSVDSKPLAALSKSSASLNLSPGRHFIRASKPGYKTWENTIYLNPQARVALPIELEPLPDAASVPTGPSPREQAEVHRRNAEQFLNKGNLEQAMSEVEQGLALAPGNPSLQSMRSRIYAAEQILARKNPLPTENKTPLLKEVLPNNREVKVVGKPSTVCPDKVKAAHKCDTVFVEVMVNEQGTVFSSKVISGPKELHALALIAARQSRFQPALRNGQPVSSQTKIAFMFNPR